MNNPFELITASKLSAFDAKELWCDDSRLDRVRGKESCFINGNRGTGKSMLFRVLQNDCQKLLFPKTEPDFLSVYFAVRDSEFMIEELQLLEPKPQSYAISESHLILLILRQLLLTLSRNTELVPESLHESFCTLLVRCIATAFEFSEVDAPEIDGSDLSSTLETTSELCHRESQRIVNHIVRRLFGKPTPFEGPLFLFDGILAPIADFFCEKVQKCLYILVDDGDDLPSPHTKVLNSWIARRRRSTVFKVSTMYAYKTFETKSSSAIQAPHDFIQYDISTRFLDYNSEDYVDLVKRICEKRLSQAGIKSNGRKIDPKEFFPQDEEQAQRIADLRKELSARYEGVFSGRAVRDNVYRHLTSEYMRKLNMQRSLATFRYAGFNTLAVLSGGLVRDFIICAQRMFDDTLRKPQSDEVTAIPPDIQNRVVRDRADQLLFEIGEADHKRSGTSDEWKAIENIVRCIGALFKRKMLSEDSERRVFSFSFQSTPDAQTDRLLELAIREGYFVRGFISNKEGTGRRTLYVLTRRLAPAFSLDVSAYSGYVSLQPKVVEQMANGQWSEDSASPKLGQGDLFEEALGPDEEWVFSESDG